METEANLISPTDIELIKMLCSQKDDEDLYNQFVNRFLQDILKECNRICIARKLHKHVGEQIAHETFERVRKYKSFNIDKVTIPNSRNAILVYLKRMVTSLFADYHRKENTEIINHKTYLEDILDSNEIELDPSNLKEKKEIAQLIFKKLNKKEQRVVITDMEYKRHQKYLPDDALEVLAKELGVKKDSIRKIRSRAIEKINLAISEINQ